RRAEDHRADEEGAGRGEGIGSVCAVADDEQTQPKPDHQPLPGAETTARWTGGKKPLDYTATAKWLVLRKKEKPSAEIFSVSYVADDGGENRPVAFVFNGGPGASSAYLHMGAIGPL